MTDDLDTLRPEVREAWRCIVADEQRPEDFECVQAELLRLARENDEWQTRCLQVQTERDKARAELAALKARIAGGELGVVAGPMKYSQAPVIFAEPDRAMALIGQRVALVKVEE